MAHVLPKNEKLPVTEPREIRTLSQWARRLKLTSLQEYRKVAPPRFVRHAIQLKIFITLPQKDFHCLPRSSASRHHPLLCFSLHGSQDHEGYTATFFIVCCVRSMRICFTVHAVHTDFAVCASCAARTDRKSETIC